MNRRKMLTKVLGAAFFATANANAAPIPKETKPFTPDVKMATNEQIREWSATNDKFFKVIDHLGTKGLTLDPNLRKSLVDNSEYYGKPSGYDNRYWSLKQAREMLGGTKIQMDDKE